ncbi:MAG: bifunctional glutamate N-acetyltransferase/amino-acid acetyltransferase ArgJ [Deltaproteobacteria bacterium]|nr:bifunctional glutamate N-acetyltransferase/amino-acid acetyltransferase ArgJ [Deltaproteobacteria bacterium]
MGHKRTFTIPGFQFAGISAGIKESHLSDLALIRSYPAATVVGAFTTNRIQAAPILVSKRNIRSGRCSAVIINSGNANACTGKRGLRDTERMVAITARTLKVPSRQVLVCSTGKIGVPLPIDRLVRGIPKAVRSLDKRKMMAAARAILTTDKGPKVAFASGKIGGKKFRIAGFAKGAGMIEPHLATMLAFFVTDLSIERRLLNKIFQESVDQTFNRITVDGDTSTNDTVLLLANGVAQNKKISPGSRAAFLFQKKLREVMEELALKIVEDGEGATKCVRIEVRGARNEEEARKVCYAVGNSPLVKTSFYGEDPNWGRILAAAGRSGATLTPETADIYYNEVCVMRRGVSTGSHLEFRAAKVMERGQFHVTIDLRRGKGSFWIWASDLTEDYVKLNSHYRT